MKPAPASRPALLRAAGWLAALGLAVALLLFGVETLARSMKSEQVRREFAQLERMLEQFKARHGSYPQTVDNSVLLRCLLGRADPRGRPIDPPQAWFMTGAQLYFRDEDPTAPGNVVVDPWGRPYLYLHYPAADGRPEGYVLASGGPDRRHSPFYTWVPGEGGKAPEDADNLWLRSRDPGSAP